MLWTHGVSPLIAPMLEQAVISGKDGSEKFRGCRARMEKAWVNILHCFCCKAAGLISAASSPGAITRNGSVPSGTNRRLVLLAAQSGDRAYASRA